ncbi:unnamed protein product, partial [Discosporangium mesarthrocarpum]
MVRVRLVSTAALFASLRSGGVVGLTLSLHCDSTTGMMLRTVGGVRPSRVGLRRRLTLVATSLESTKTGKEEVKTTALPGVRPGKPRTRLTSTGGLKGLPIVTPSVELLSHATRRSKKISQDMDIKNGRNRARKWTAERMDMLGKSVSKPLRDIVRQYKRQLPILHPFEATLADLTVRAREKSGSRTLKMVLDDVNEFRKITLEISKAAAQAGKAGEKKVDILETMDRGYADVEEHFRSQGHVIEDLTEIQKSLRGLPIVQLHLPTIVLVGAPNVGKSSIVRAVSTGTPELMDTPGVLSRPDDARNEMESLTLASMQ